MSQLQLSLLGRLDAPSKVPADEVRKVSSYREAVIACWMNRRVKSMTKATLAELTGMRPSHITDYFSPELLDRHGKERRDMPGKYIPGLERVAGNTHISQWLAMQHVVSEEQRSA